MVKERPYGGWNEDEQLAAQMEQDKGALRRNALVLYRCHHGCLLGYAYPVTYHPERVGQDTVDSLAEGDPGRLHRLVGSGPRPRPWGPWLVENFLLQPGEQSRLAVTAPVEDWWFFAYRHIDPEFEFFSDPSDPNTVGWGPAESIGQSKRATQDQIAKSGPAAWNDEADDWVSPSLREIKPIGRRDTVVLSSARTWEHLENSPPTFSLNNPPGLVNCTHAEYTLTHGEVLADMEGYKPRNPVILPRR